MIAVLNWSIDHWWVFFWLSIFGVFRGVRDFLHGTFEAIAGIGERRHKRRMKELRLRAQIAALPETRVGITPGLCVHRNVTPVVSVADEVVAWLCKSCDEKLPAGWAVREGDL
jgi:hypothetical protein